MTNCPGPADIPRPCTTMDVVVCGASCWTVQRTVALTRVAAPTVQSKPPDGVTGSVWTRAPPKVTNTSAEAPASPLLATLTV